jgi:hypothetical protein
LALPFEQNIPVFALNFEPFPKVFCSRKYKAIGHSLAVFETKLSQSSVGFHLNYYLTLPKKLKTRETSRQYVIKLFRVILGITISE